MTEIIHIQRTRISNMNGRQRPVYLAVIPVPLQFLKAKQAQGGGRESIDEVLKAIDSNDGSCEIGTIAENVLLQRLSLELVASYSPVHTKRVAEAIIKDYNLDYRIEDAQYGLDALD